MQNVQQRINFRDNDDKWKEYAFQKVKEEIIKEKNNHLQDHYRSMS